MDEETLDEESAVSKANRTAGATAQSEQDLSRPLGAAAASAPLPVPAGPRSRAPADQSPPDGDAEDTFPGYALSPRHGRLAGPRSRPRKSR